MYGKVCVDNNFRITNLYTAFRSRYEENYYFQGEQHDFWELVAVLSGQIGVTAGSEVFVLDQGQAILHPPREFHRLWSEGNSCPEIVIFTFDGENMPRSQGKIFQMENPAEPERVVEHLRSACVTRGISLTEIREGAQLAGWQAVKELELLVLRLLRSAGARTTVNSRSARNFETIVNTLQTNLHRHLSISEIAQMCYMSPVSVKQTFSRYAGMSIMAYFNNLKITAAISMLKSGMTVQEVAQRLGFSSQNYFSTVFKRIRGVSPSTFKQGRE